MTLTATPPCPTHTKKLKLVRFLLFFVNSHSYWIFRLHHGSIAAWAPQGGGEANFWHSRCATSQGFCWCFFCRAIEIEDQVWVLFLLLYSFILIGILRCVLSAKTKVGVTTAHRHAKVLELQNTILRNLSDLHQSQCVYMPGVASILDEAYNNEASNDTPKLWLPSDASAEDWDIWCLLDIPTLEFQFCYVQADNSLAELHHLHWLLQGLQDQNKKHLSQSQKNSTHSQGLFEGFKARIKRTSSRYSHAHNTMLALDWDEKLGPGWMQWFQKLNKSNIRRPGCEEDNTSEGQFMLSWIWLVPHSSDPPPAAIIHPSNVPGSKTMMATNEHTVVNDTELVDSMHVHWAKCQAQAERYEEEVTLTIEEMGHTLSYFQWKQSWWFSLGSEQARSDSPPSVNVQRGLTAYAQHQGRIYDMLVISFVNQWRKTLATCGYSPVWLSQYPQAADPLSSRPSHGHSQLMTEPAASMTNRKSTQMECNPSLSDPQQTPKPIDAPLASELGSNNREGHDIDDEDTGDKDPYTQWAHGEYIVGTDNT